MSLRQGLRTAGSATLVVLIALSAMDQLTNSGLSVLAPNIRDTLHVSNGTIVFISSAAGGFIVLGALPMGWLADRYRRPPIIAWASLAFSVMLVVSGFAVNAFMLFWAQLGAGVSKSNTISVQWSLIADQYPIGVRGRISATLNFGTQTAAALSPLLMAGIATVAGGSAGWRWAFVALAIPVAVVALLAFRLPEPVRGQYEKSSVLGTVIDDKSPAPISVEAAFARIRRIRTLMSAIVGFAALGLRPVHRTSSRQPVLAAALSPEHFLPGLGCDDHCRQRRWRSCRGPGSGTTGCTEVTHRRRSPCWAF